MKKNLFPFLTIFFLCSCSNYYKAITTSGPPVASSIEDLSKKNRYFIIRDTAMAYAIKNISLTADRNNIQGILESVPDNHTTHLWVEKNAKLKYSKSNEAGAYEAFVLSEVHLHIPTNANLAPGPFTFPLSSFNKTEVLEKDIKKTRKNHTIVWISTVAGIALVTAGIAGIALANMTFF